MEQRIKGGNPDCRHSFNRYYIAGMLPLYVCRCGAYYFEDDKIENVAPKCKFTDKFYNKDNPTCCWKHKWLGVFIGN